MIRCLLLIVGRCSWGRLSCIKRSQLTHCDAWLNNYIYIDTTCVAMTPNSTRNLIGCNDARETGGMSRTGNLLRERKIALNCFLVCNDAQLFFSRKFDYRTRRNIKKMQHLNQASCWCVGVGLKPQGSKIARINGYGFIHPLTVERLYMTLLMQLEVHPVQETVTTAAVATQ